jgi:hypothetical protein
VVAMAPGDYDISSVGLKSRCHTVSTSKTMRTW